MFTPTPEQQAILDHEGNCFVMALSGSGKTSIIAEKIKKIKAEKPTARILYITFTRKARSHAEDKLEGLSGVRVTNYHSLACQFLNDHKSVLKVSTIDIVHDGYCVKVLMNLLGVDARTARGILKQLESIKHNELSRSQMDGEAYDTFERFMDAMESSKKFTFSDLIYKMNRLFIDGKVLPHVAIKNTYDYIFLDEQQDNYFGEFRIIDHLMSLNPSCIVTGVGDLNQCSWAGTQIGNKKVEDLVPGDMVPTYKRGEVVDRKVVNVAKSSWSRGYKITTGSGKVLGMSPNHRIHATGFNFADGKVNVYIMYREGFGYRVGITKKGSNENREQTTIAARMRQEHASKMWILARFNTLEEAMYYEKDISLKYRVPTLPFVSRTESWDYQDMINRLFHSYGGNGLEALKDHDLDTRYPHITAHSDTDNSRYVLTIISEGKRGSSVRIEFLENEILKKYLGKFGEVTSAKKVKQVRYRFRAQRASYADALKLADTIIAKAPVHIFKVEKLYVDEDTGNPKLITASALFPSMSVLVRSGDSTQLEVITKVEKITGEFYDIEVEDTHTFFGNDILSHNSIYSYTDADPSLCLSFIKKFDAKTLVLSKNFRSQSNVVALGNSMLNTISEFADYRPEMVPHHEPTHPVELTNLGDSTSQYNHVCRTIQTLVHEKGYNYNDFYVLFRTNKSGVEIDKMAVKMGIPFALQRGSFLSRKAVRMLVDTIMFSITFVDYKDEAGEEVIFKQLKDIAEELSANIAKKLLKAVHDHKCVYSLMDKIKNIRTLSISGVGNTRKAGFEDFYVKVTNILDAYAKYKSGEYDLQRYFSEIIKVVLSYKSFTTAEQLAYDNMTEDLTTFVDIISEIEGDLATRVNTLLIDYGEEEDADEKDKVQGLTVHKAKGLENKVVFIIDFDQFPPFWLKGKEDYNESEERRIAYVAITRAEERLYLTCSSDRVTFADAFQGLDCIKTNVPLMREEY
jgi:DNA helicase-2/ATP-dependent DNA helicase PcrA